MNTTFKTTSVIYLLKKEGFNGMAKRFKAAYRTSTVESEDLMAWLKKEFVFPNSPFPTYLYKKMIPVKNDDNLQEVGVSTNTTMNKLDEISVEQRVKDLEKRLYDCSKTNAELIGKINELPTWEDVRRAISMARETEHDKIKSADEIIELLKNNNQ